MHLESQKVYLRPISEKDTSDVVRWRNCAEVRHNLYAREQVTEQTHLKWMETNVHTGCCDQFIIVDKAVGRGIGSIFIKNLDKYNQKGEYGIFIGEPDAYGKGYATEASRLILRYAFEEKGLHRVYLSVYSDNLGAIKVYQKVGFRVEGTLRQDMRRDGIYEDILMMGILCKDWEPC